MHLIPKKNLEESMATKNPRINITIDRSTYKLLKEISKKEGVSISSFVRELTREALELREDVELGKFAEEREKSFDKREALSHKEIWD